LPKGAALLLAATLLVPGVLGAQAAPDSARTSPSLTVELRRDSTGTLIAPRVRARSLMGDGAFEGALRNGFPVRFGFHLALWRDAALFDHLEKEADWDAVVILDPVENTYQLLRTGGGQVEVLTDVPSLERALATPFTVNLMPTRRGNDRYYYLATLTIESLSISELEEVERWLTGDLGRAITQRGDVGNAFSRGARLALIRLSGLPRRVLDARTDMFRP
jgi:hypothetical protein